LSEQGWFVQTHIHAGAPKDVLLVKAPNSPHGTGQAHNSSMRRPGF